LTSIPTNYPNQLSNNLPFGIVGNNNIDGNT